jgi:chorismate mutase
MEGTSYYIVHESAMPSVLKKVAEANRLLSSGEVRTVNEAVEKVGIARSSYYKFKDSVEEFHNNLPGSMLTIVCEVSDRAGILSDLLQTIARCGANILTIHQAIPADGTAVVSISMQMLENADSVRTIIDRIVSRDGVLRVRVTGR